MINQYLKPNSWWVTALVFVATVVLLNFTVNIEAANDSNIENGYSFTSNQTTFRKFGSCDATNKYFYFSYESDTSRIDTYDSGLNYLYTIEFPDIQNSSMYIRTEQDLLYVRLRCGNVYVFCGQEEISRMSREEADEKGYSRDWFRQAESRLYVDNNTLHIRDENGNLSNTIDIPETLFSTTGQSNFLRASFWVGIAAIMYFFRSLCAALIRKCKKR